MCFDNSEPPYAIIENGDGQVHSLSLVTQSTEKILHKEFTEIGGLLFKGVVDFFFY